MRTRTVRSRLGRRVEETAQGSQRLPPVAALVLEGRRQLGGGQARGRVLENRVVAKARMAARSPGDTALPGTLGQHRLGVAGIAHVGEDAAETRRAPAVG